ncbi:hypothetical protein POTOM_015147 [Populus tomentosa]|uniref:Syntaxin 6/10/61 N-terminal domain-containing protein n=1 Tax=Populus tomentosa TaxID=118781 RepID=A0A8X8A1D0_POPTO|nr:hypothetical protein POTOM_015147 [Populus tomentosa]
MSSAQDPFYIVKEEIQESIDKLQSSFHQWERISSDSGEQVHLTKELLAACESIEWQVDELDKAISVAARDPSWYGIDEAELEKRRRWTSTARAQVGNVKKAVVAGKELNLSGTASVNGMRRELMRMPDIQQTDKSNQYTQDNDDFIQSESDRQMLLIKQQDEELDELSASVERIGGVGLTIHEELLAQLSNLVEADICLLLGLKLFLVLQERIIDDLDTEMDTTSNRLDFVQNLLFVYLFIYLLAEKSGHGHEEGQRKGATYDDSVLGSFVHHPICSGLLDLIHRKSGLRCSYIRDTVVMGVKHTGAKGKRNT